MQSPNKYISWKIWKGPSVNKSGSLPPCQPIDRRPVKLQVTSPLPCTGQSCHDGHELRETRSIPIGQHVCCHGNKCAEEDGADSFANLTVVTHNVSGEQLQQLSVFLHHFQLLRVLGRRRRHAGQPGLQARRFHTGQLGQRPTQTQQAWVWTLLSYRE